MEQAQAKSEIANAGVKTELHSDDAKKLSTVIIPVYPLIRFADLEEGTMTQDIIEMVIDVTERHISDLEVASKVIKEQLDKDYSTTWHVVIGENFAFDVSYEPMSFLYFYNGLLSVLLFKCE